MKILDIDSVMTTVGVIIRTFNISEFSKYENNWEIFNSD